MSSAGLHNFICDQGATFLKTITFFASNGTTAIDLTGYACRMKIKEEYGGTVLKSLTNSSGMTIGGGAGDPTNGEIDISISATDTANFDAPQTAVYDIEIISSGGIVHRILQGKFIVNPEVTD
tara:strand:- start:401 stop:769 length:369 start_codon:yes stop_codon:yes gene_type:complete